MMLYYLFGAGSPQISKNLGAISKFGAPEGWHEASSTLRTHNPGKIWEPHCYLRFLIGAREVMLTFVRNRPTNAIILLNILYSTVQYLVTCETWRPGFMHQWWKILWNTSRHMPCTPHVLSSLHVEARNQANSDGVKNSAFLLIAVLLRTFCRSTGYRVHIVKKSSFMTARDVDFIYSITMPHSQSWDLPWNSTENALNPSHRFKDIDTLNSITVCGVSK
jgi:hypothetical protein